MIQRSRPIRRTGFTFVELLMVIAIIAVLAALLLGGISKVMALQVRTETVSDITQMAQSLEQAKAGYIGHPEFLPSALVLHHDKRVYQNPDTAINPDVFARTNVSMRELTKRSAAVLQAMFGRRVFQSRSTAGPTQHLLNWNGANDVTARPIILSGPECLVFYLGGMPDGGANPKCIGFSKDPLDPSLPGGSDRIGPFFDFKSSRLVTGSSRFYQYLDAYPTRTGFARQPYAYFGAFGPNDYAPANIYRTNLTATSPTYTNTDNAPALPNAYFDSTTSSASTKWLYPTKYQIISAGPDRVFGVATALDLKEGTLDLNAKDNLANFSSTELGNTVE